MSDVLKIKPAKKSKGTKEEVDDALHEICITEWDTEYRVLWKDDDGGNHVVVAFEGVPENCHEKLKSPFMGWRLIKLNVPEGYLKVFHPLNK